MGKNSIADCHCVICSRVRRKQRNKVIVKLCLWGVLIALLLVFCHYAKAGTAAMQYDTITHAVKKPPVSAGAIYDLDFTGLTLGGISGGGGSGDVVGPASSVDGEVALFNGTSGKAIKRATGTGILTITSGVSGTITDSHTNWDTAFTDRLKWDGGATGLNAATGRTSLGLVIGTNVQAFDADLTSWAAITRASGFDTFTATPSSANLASLVTNETGTAGNLVFSGNPTIDAPTINLAGGGTATFPSTTSVFGTPATGLHVDSSFNGVTQVKIKSGSLGALSQGVLWIDSSSGDFFIHVLGDAFTTSGILQTDDSWIDAYGRLVISVGQLGHVGLMDSVAPILFSNDGGGTEGARFYFGQTVASGASATLDEFKIDAKTSTISGGTNITTATGFNKAAIYRPTYTDSSSVTVTNAATLWIENSPLASGSVTITNPYALWVDNGVTRLDGNLQINVASGLLKASSNIVSAATAGTDYADSSFKTISVSGQSDVVADSAADTLTLAAGSNVTITTNAGTDTVTIASTGGSGSPGGSDTQIQFNDAGSFAGDADLIWNKTTNLLTLSGTQTVVLNNATTNAVDTLLTLNHDSTGTPANGLGARISFGLESSTTVDQQAGAIDVSWTDVTNLSRTSKVAIRPINSGSLSTGIQVFGSGGASLSNTTDPGLGIFSANVGYWVGTSASTNGKILKSDGAAFKPSTETYAAPGTSGNVMTSDGTNWTSAAAASQVNDTAFASSWNGVTTIAPSKNAVYDWGHTFDTDDDGKVNVLDQSAGITNTDASGVIQSPITAPSGAIVGTTDTQTLTNKRVTPRVGTTASSATPTINTDNVDEFTITALATNITSMTTNLSGTPTEGQKLLIWIKDNGSARTISWGASFAASTDLALPTTTTAGKYLYCLFVWNATSSKWTLLAKLDNI